MAEGPALRVPCTSGNLDYGFALREPRNDDRSRKAGWTTDHDATEKNPSKKMPFAETERRDFHRSRKGRVWRG